MVDIGLKQTEEYTLLGEKDFNRLVWKHFDLRGERDYNIMSDAGVLFGEKSYFEFFISKYPLEWKEVDSQLLAAVIVALRGDSEFLPRPTATRLFLGYFEANEVLRPGKYRVIAL